MIFINPSLSIDESEVQFSAIRAMGNGGQNVNKVSSAIHLRFDIKASSLNEKQQARLLGLSDSRLTKDGVIIIKAQSFRTQETNKEDAIKRLKVFINEGLKEDKPRRATRPSLSSKRKRLDSKKRAGFTKSLRKKIDF